MGVYNSVYMHRQMLKMGNLNQFTFFWFETGSHNVAQASLKLTILLP
jgi:hypothetical protein